MLKFQGCISQRAVLVTLHEQSTYYNATLEFASNSATTTKFLFLHQQGRSQKIIMGNMQRNVLLVDFYPSKNVDFGLSSKYFSKTTERKDDYASMSAG